MKTHKYEIKVQWTGNRGEGTLNYKSYDRNHLISGNQKYSEILASSDPSFLGEQSKYNPEDLFISSLSSCHMLWYLHLCSINKIIVINYLDTAIGIMDEDGHNGGKFREVVLNPKIIISHEKMIKKATDLHITANKMCYIANSCNFDIKHNPTIKVKLSK